MSKIERVLGLVVARGGSKGVPGKNLRPLGGHPLIAYAVRGAIKAPSISRAVLSTDDEQIAETAKHYGIEVPFMRPPEMATDHSPVFDTIHYTIDRLEKEGDRFDALFLVQPTAPFRSIDDIEQSIEVLRRDDEAKSVVSLAEVVDGHPARLRRIENGRVVQFLDQGGDIEGQQRQSHGDRPAYRRNGACYVTRRDTIMLQRTLFGDKTAPYIMPAWRSVNIDEELDLLLAQAMIEHEPFKLRLAYLSQLFD